MNRKEIEIYKKYSKMNRPKDIENVCLFQKNMAAPFRHELKILN